MISVSTIYEFIQFDAFGTTAFNVSRVLHCIAKRMAPGPNSTKDISSCVWLSLDGFVDISRGRLDKPKTSKAIKWLRERGFVVEKKIGNTVYRALSQTGIDRVKEYAIATVVDSTMRGCGFHNGGVVDSTMRGCGFHNGGVVDSTTNRGIEEGKEKEFNLSASLLDLKDYSACLTAKPSQEVGRAQNEPYVGPKMDPTVGAETDPYKRKENIKENILRHPPDSITPKKSVSTSQNQNELNNKSKVNGLFNEYKAYFSGGFGRYDYKVQRSLWDRAIGAECSKELERVMRNCHGEDRPPACKFAAQKRMSDQEYADHIFNEALGIKKTKEREIIERQKRIEDDKKLKLQQNDPLWLAEQEKERRELAAAMQRAREKMNSI